MDEKLLNLDYRQRIIEQINGQENIERKSQSKMDCDVYSGNIEPYVLEKFNNKYKPETVAEIPIVSTINISEKVVNSTASIYKDAPERSFLEVSEQQEESLEKVYQDLWFDTKMLSANRYFKLQKQTHVMVLPKNGKLHARVIKQHQLDVIPNDIDPEIGEVYILTGFDDMRNSEKETQSNGTNEEIADQDDYRETLTRHVVWSKDYHFVMDGRGNILTEDVINPIGAIPIVEIAEDKDLVYFLEHVNNDTKFTVEYNEALSNQSLVVMMQGFSQAVMMAPEELMPSSITVGPTKILKIITNSNIEGETDFKFVNPNSDLDGVRAHTESLLSQYLSSKGLDANAITGSAQASGHSSGVSKLLAMVERFEASKSDLARFEQAEKAIFDIIVKWLNVAGDFLEDKYTAGQIPEDAALGIVYKEPQAIMSKAEALDIIERKLEIGLISLTEAVAKDRNISDTEAEDVLKNIQVEITEEGVEDDSEQTEIQGVGSLPEVQP
jgi:hypothetical protein